MKNTKIKAEISPEQEYRKLEFNLERINKKKKSWILPVFSVCFGLVFFCLFFTMFRQGGRNTIESTFFSVAFSGIISALYCMYMYMALDVKVKNIKQRMIELESDDIRKNEEYDVCEKSLQMSYKYLDQYYHQTRHQAQRGFTITSWVAVVGFLLIGGGVITMFCGKTVPAYITCAAGVVTEFVSSVFFYLYNKTITSMSKYHDKLVLSHNVSVALKVADSLPEELKHEAKQNIINEIVKDVNNHLINSKE